MQRLRAVPSAHPSGSTLLNWLPECLPPRVGCKCGHVGSGRPGPGLQARAGPYKKWWWVLKGVKPVHLGFPAVPCDITKWGARARVISPAAAIRMEKDWRLHVHGRNKRPREDPSSEEARALEQDLRSQLSTCREPPSRKGSSAVGERGSRSPRRSSSRGRDSSSGLPPSPRSGPPPLGQPRSLGRGGGGSVTDGGGDQGSWRVDGGGDRRARDGEVGQFRQVRKGDGGGRGGFGQATTEVMCFKCGCNGHYQIECKNEPLCFLCKEEGHTSSACPLRQVKPELVMYGFGVKDQGFYQLEGG
ncbi:uncharacterized protein [Triticum aestivum]|uniref:uncharacterized protein n=1 Tax=Triticum aestivum TaxID=4565 RepID=UPI001D02EACE|nr:uncharacterized protein LOC123172123 [Triticum aestivum]